MSLLFGRRAEQRVWSNVPFNVSDGVLTHTRSAGSMSGAMHLVPLYAAVSMITDSISTCPWAGFNNRNTAGGGSKMNSQPGLLTDPGPFKLSLSGWKSQMASSLLLRGNAYGLIAARDGRMTPTKIMWLHPDWVHVDEREREPRYYVQGKFVDSSQLVHIQGGVTLPGSCVSLAPITHFRLQIETGLRVEQYKHNWYDDTSVPRGILFNKMGTVTGQQATDAKDRFKAAVQGHDVLVTGNDWAWQPLTPTAADAQFIQATQMSATQIATLYHVPPEEIGGVVAQALTYKTLEANSIKYAQQAVHPWLHRIDEAITAILPNPQFVKSDEDALIRTELAARMQAYQTALSIGAYTQDKVRQLENEAPMTPDEYTKWKTDFAGKAPAAAEPPPGPLSDPTEGTPPK